jgi:hypothetical protein
MDLEEEKGAFGVQLTHEQTLGVKSGETTSQYNTWGHLFFVPSDACLQTWVPLWNYGSYITQNALLQWKDVKPISVQNRVISGFSVTV